jgi:hypothetical protein
MEIGEGPKLKFFEIDAPERLENGQGFYDQEPFSTIVGKHSEETGADSLELRYGITRFARTKGLGHAKEATKGVIDPNTLNSIVADARGYFKLPQKDMGNFAEALKKVIRELAEFPNWLEYVLVQLHRGDYNSAGEFDPKGRVQIGTPESYGAWVDRKYTTAQRQMLSGIEEVFPQGAFQTSVPESYSKENAQTKRWRILKASELLFPRK